MLKIKYLKYFLLLCFCTLGFAGQTAQAHPVSYKDGFGIMPEYASDRKELELNYSVTSSHALGVSIIDLDFRDEDATFILPRFNYRLFRQNELESQANIYVSAAAGGVEYKDDDDLAGFLFFQGDYETRRIYTLLSGQTLQSGGVADVSSFRYRFGVAPYLTGFDGFHTWLIGQVDYSPDMKDEWTVTPLVRFFYSYYLIEVGSSTRGDLFVAGIFHF